MKFFLLILRNIGRNKLRSVLTATVTIVLVFVVTLVWSILAMLDAMTTEKSKNFRAMVTERWSAPSRMPFSYADSLSRGAARNPGDIQPQDAMTWQFYGGTLDPLKLTRESIVFAIACEPNKILTMMEGLDDLPPDQAAELRENVARLQATRAGIILGRNHLRLMNKRVGDRVKLFGFSTFKGIDLEFTIVGAFPPGRYDTLAAFNRDYFNNELDAYATRNNGRKHALAERNLSIVLLKVPSTEAYTRIAQQIESSPYYTNPSVKCETFSAGISTFLESFRDLIWGMRWLLAPACLTTILLVIANAISISVRERRREMAVLKVLGFRPYQLLILVLGESLLLGAGAGLLSVAMTYGVINWWLEGLKFPIAFFDRFMIPTAAFWWGPAVGAIAALLGSFLPAWSARSVKVAEVFAKVA